MNFASQGRWTYRLSELVKNNGKYPSRKVQTFLDGGTPRLAYFQSKKPTTYRGNIRIRPRRAYGVRYGTQNSSLKRLSSYGS
jgi:hypothetical protein